MQYFFEKLPALLALCLALGLAFFWQRQYAALGRSMRSMHDAPPATALPGSQIPVMPVSVPPSAPAAPTDSVDLAPAGQTADAAMAPPAPAVPAEQLQAANGAPSHPFEPGMAGAEKQGAPPAAPELPPETAFTLTGKPTAQPVGKMGPGPLIRLKGTDGSERLGVVLERGLALGPQMDLVYEAGVMRIESLATEPVSLFQVNATKTVPVVGGLGEKAGTAVKICGLGPDGVDCVPAKLRRGLFYNAADDHLLLEAGSFNGDFPGGAALFKTGAGGGFLGYQSGPVTAAKAQFLPVNYFGRFSRLRSDLGPLLSVTFSDMLMQGRNNAGVDPLAQELAPTAPSVVTVVPAAPTVAAPQ